MLKVIKCLLLLGWSLMCTKDYFKANHFFLVRITKQILEITDGIVRQWKFT